MNNTLRFLSKLLLAATLLMSMQPVMAADLKIGVVDIEGVIAQSEMGKALQKELADFRSAAQAEIKSLQDKAIALENQAKTQQNTLSADKVAELKTEYEKVNIQMKRFSDDKQAEGTRLRNQGLAKIEQSLGPVFEKLRDADGFDLIISRNSVIIHKNTVDISQLVLDRLNAGNK